MSEHNRSAALAARKGLVAGGRVRWNAAGRAAFALPDPNVHGDFDGPSSVGGFGIVHWDNRRSVDTVDLHFIEAAA